MLKHYLVIKTLGQQTFFLQFLNSLFYLPINKLGMPHIYGKLISKLKDAKFDNSLYYFVILIVLWFFIQGLKIISSLIRANLLPKFNSYVREQLIFTIIDKYKTNYEDERLILNQAISQSIFVLLILVLIRQGNYMLNGLPLIFLLYHFNRKEFDQLVSTSE